MTAPRSVAANSESFDNGVRYDDQYFLDGGDVVLSTADRCLFQIHSHFLVRESSYFHALLSRPAPSYPLGSVTSSEFRQLLVVWYNEEYTFSAVPAAQWITILALATKWRFAKVIQLALRELHTREMEPVARIALYEAHNVDARLLAPALRELVRRAEPLTPEEGRRMRAETALGVARARELVRMPGKRARREPARVQASEREIVAIVQETVCAVPARSSSPCLRGGDKDVLSSDEELEVAGHFDDEHCRTSTQTRSNGLPDPSSSIASVSSASTRPTPHRQLVNSQDDQLPRPHLSVRIPADPVPSKAKKSAMPGSWTPSDEPWELDLQLIAAREGKERRRKEERRRQEEERGFREDEVLYREARRALRGERQASQKVEEREAEDARTPSRVGPSSVRKDVGEAEQGGSRAETRAERPVQVPKEHGTEPCGAEPSISRSHFAGETRAPENGEGGRNGHASGGNGAVDGRAANGDYGPADMGGTGDAYATARDGGTKTGKTSRRVGK